MKYSSWIYLKDCVSPDPLSKFMMPSFPFPAPPNICPGRRSVLYLSSGQIEQDVATLCSPSTASTLDSIYTPGRSERNSCGSSNSSVRQRLVELQRVATTIFRPISVLAEDQSSASVRVRSSKTLQLYVAQAPPVRSTRSTPASRSEPKLSRFFQLAP